MEYMKMVERRRAIIISDEIKRSLIQWSGGCPGLFSVLLDYISERFSSITFVQWHSFITDNSLVSTLFYQTATYSKMLDDLKTLTDQKVIQFVCLLLANEDHVVEAKFKEHELTLLAFGVVDTGQAECIANCPQTYFFKAPILRQLLHTIFYSPKTIS